MKIRRITPINIAARSLLKKTVGNNIKSNELLLGDELPVDSFNGRTIAQRCVIHKLKK